jgi:DNA polymerase-3 subunit delta
MSALNYRTAHQLITSGRFAPAYLFFGAEAFLREELTVHLGACFLGEASQFGLEKVDGAAVSLAAALARLEGTNLFAPRRLLVIDNPPYLAPPPAKKEQEQGKVRDRERDQGDQGDQEDQGDQGQDQGQDQDRGQVRPPAPPATVLPEDPSPALLEQFLEQAGSPGQPDQIIVFRTPGADRRRRLFKLLEQKGAAVECAPLKGDELAGWIRGRAAQAGLKLEPAALESLLLTGENDLYRLSNELDKYGAYLADGEETITAAVVDQLFAGDAQGNVFKLADALGEGSLSRALELLDLLLRRREEPVRIFFMLVRHFRLLLLARSLRDERVHPRQHAEVLGVQPFAARKLFEQAAAYSRETLEEIMITLQGIDSKIKTGRLAPRQALELTLSRLYQMRM